MWQALNKIQFLLATTEIGKLINDIVARLELYRSEFGLEDTNYYRQKLSHQSRFDTKEVIFVKRLLQRELPFLARQRIGNELFSKYVTNDEASFAGDLYMDKNDLGQMKEAGMYIGSHGFEHDWLEIFDRAHQEKQIDRSVQFLRDLGWKTDAWVMCYPYGSYNQTLLELLSKKGCVAGLTTRVDIANLSMDNLLTLPRLDTNDLPKQGEAPASEWTSQANFERHQV